MSNIMLTQISIILKFFMIVLFIISENYESYFLKESRLKNQFSNYHLNIFSILPVNQFSSAFIIRSKVLSA